MNNLNYVFLETCGCQRDVILVNSFRGTAHGVIWEASAFATERERVGLREMLRARLQKMCQASKKIPTLT